LVSHRQGALDVADVGLRHQRHDAGARLAQVGDLRVVGGGGAGAPGRAERRQLRRPQ
jgi:hypothetical protein